MGDKNCMVPPNRLQQIRAHVKFIGTPKTGPKWQITRGVRKSPGKKIVQGIVRCPYTSANGKALTETEAERRILGQVGAIKMPLWLWMPAYKVLAPRFLMKISYSTVLMLKCWKAHCSK